MKCMGHWLVKGTMTVPYYRTVYECVWLVPIWKDGNPERARTMSVPEGKLTSRLFPLIYCTH